MGKYVFPFEKIDRGSNIIIYGAGLVGTEFLNIIELTGYCNVAAVLDRDRAGEVFAGNPIMPPEAISGIAKESYDTVLVAIMRKKVRLAAAENLSKYGVEHEKILLYDGTRAISENDGEHIECYDDGGDVLKLALIRPGGLGDHLMLLPLVYGLRKSTPSGLQIDIYTGKAREIYERAPFVDCVYPRDEYLEDNDYDVVLNCHLTHIIMKHSSQKTKRISPALHEYLKTLLWQSENLFSYGALYNVLNAVSYANIVGAHSIETGDLMRVLPFNRDTPVYLEYDKKAIRLLEDRELSKTQYITICDDVNMDLPRSLKRWPNKYFNALTQLLKEKYPQYKIVRIGQSGNPGEIANIDIDLCGTMRWDELCAILKHSALHIGCEGGLIHLKHALNGISACLFGPTALALFSYAENVNLRSSEPKNCTGGCNYIGKYWHTGGCLIDFDAEYAPCMTSLTPEYVFGQISEYLDNLTRIRYEQYGTIQPEEIETTIGAGFDAALIYREGERYILPLAGKLNSLTIIDKDLSEEPVTKEAPINMRYWQRMHDLGVEAEYGNLHNIPAAAGRYDLTVNFTMPKEECPEFALREMARVTKPGGTVAVMADSGDLVLYLVENSEDA